jgi:hypothetical protein
MFVADRFSVGFEVVEEGIGGDVISKCQWRLQRA